MHHRDHEFCSIKFELNGKRSDALWRVMTFLNPLFRYFSFLIIQKYKID